MAICVEPETILSCTLKQLNKYEKIYYEDIIAFIAILNQEISKKNKKKEVSLFVPIPRGDSENHYDSWRNNFCYMEHDESFSIKHTVSGKKEQIQEKNDIIHRYIFIFRQELFSIGFSTDEIDEIILNSINKFSKYYRSKPEKISVKKLHLVKKNRPNLTIVEEEL